MAERLEISRDTNQLEAPPYNPGKILKYALIGGVVGFALFGFIGGLTSAHVFELSVNRVMLGAISLGTSGAILGVLGGAYLAAASELGQRHS